MACPTISQGDKLQLVSLKYKQLRVSHDSGNNQEILNGDEDDFKMICFLRLSGECLHVPVSRSVLEKVLLICMMIKYIG